MTERDWVSIIVPQIQAKLYSHFTSGPAVEVVEQHRLAYTHEIESYLGNVPDKITKAGYATDILIRDGQSDSWVPRVVIETKLGSVTTHDALTYSSKAATHKQVHPYLRYGIIIGNWGDYPLPARLFRHGAYFDFMMTWKSLDPQEAELNSFAEVVEV